MSKIMHIQGTLLSRRANTVTSEVTALFNEVLTRHQLPNAITQQETTSTIMVSCSVTAYEEPIPVYSTEHGAQLNAAFRFIDALEELMEMEDLKALKLSGGFVAIVESEVNPLAVIITVEEKGIFYQEGTVTVAK